jgi:RHS repeat-associated protein
VFHANRRVDPAAEYAYDPIYRLLAATGREHTAQSAFSFAPAGGDYRDFPFVGAAHLHDPHALCRYAEHYEYDGAGNVLRLRHETPNGEFDRSYCYGSPSLLEPQRKNNRLSHSTVQDGPLTLSERYSHDAHGNMTQLPHLPHMSWDFQDRLRKTSRQVVNLGTPEQTFYIYDAAGQRVRKVTLRQDGTRKNGRYYLGGFEIYRTYGAGGVELQRDTLHVMDDERRIAMIESLTTEYGKPLQSPVSVSRYQLANHLGSASLELDGLGALLTYEEYSPYGNSTFQATSSAEASLKRYRYTGKERDEETGFTYHGARYYAPWLARWTSADSIFRAGLSNAYQYVRCNPIIFHDPSGRDWTRFWGGMRAAGGLVQAVGGVAFAGLTAETGVGIAGGLFVAAHGLSDYEAGLRQMQTGKEAKSITQVAISSGLQAVHVEKDTADAAATAADVTLGFVNPSGPIAGGPRAALALASGGQRAQAAVHVLPQLAAVSAGLHGIQATHVVMSANNSGDHSSGGAADSGGGSKSPPAKDPVKPSTQGNSDPVGRPAPQATGNLPVAASTLGPGETLLAHNSPAGGKAGLMAQLGKDDRILDLYIAKGPNTPTGGEMFEEAIKAFGLSNIKGIRGTWLGGGDLRTNFDAFQKAIKAGLTPEQAAFETFTGAMAKRFGFTKATVTTNEAKKVVVEFTR